MATNTLIDMLGQKFGRLTVIERAENTKEGRARWKCKCECGNEVIVLGKHLRSGSTKSCGCLQKQRTSEASLIDLTGKRFGKLLVLSRIPGRTTSNGKVMWHCLCDCGTELDVLGDSLRRNHTLSCGCIASQGELIITELLKLHNINFKKEINFIDGKYSDTNTKFFYDFGIYDDDDKLLYLIEYDGYQHFNRIGGWNTKEHNELTHQRDMIKNNYCFSHHIPLIRIPYVKKDNLTINDLLLSSSSYIITPDNVDNYYQTYNYSE